MGMEILIIPKGEIEKETEKTENNESNNEVFHR